MWDFSGNFKERFGSLLTSGFRSDLKIIVSPQNKEEVEINAHKIFLEAGSRVLDAKIRQDGDQLVFIDVEPAIVKLMLKYFYTGKSGVDLNQALRLLQLATENEVKELVEECEQSLLGEITEENVLPLFEEGMLYGHAPTIERTLQFICRNGSEILKLIDFIRLRLECLIEIIDQDALVVENEMEVFEAVYRWGVAECTRQSLDPNDAPTMRTILEKVLKYVRFPLMKSEEFALKVATKNLLLMDEQMALLMTFLVPFGQRSSLPEGRFISTPRGQLKLEPLPIKAEKSCDDFGNKIPNEYIQPPGACALNWNSNDGKVQLYYISRRKGTPINFQYLDLIGLPKVFMEKLRVKSNKTFLLEGIRIPKEVFSGLDNIDISLFVDVSVMDSNGESYVDGNHTFQKILTKNGDWYEFLFAMPSLWIYVGERVDINIEFNEKFQQKPNKFNFKCYSNMKVGEGYGVKVQMEEQNEIEFEFSRPEKGKKLEISKGFVDGLIVSY